MSKEYVGTKIIKAWEADKNGLPGYGVQYKDGYVSWSPKAAFEEAYLPIGNIGHLPEPQQRLIAEFVELKQRLEELTHFLDSEEYKAVGISDEELADLQEQRALMQELADVLTRRVGRISQRWTPSA